MISNIITSRPSNSNQWSTISHTTSVDNLLIKVEDLQAQFLILQKELKITHLCLKFHNIDYEKYKQSIELMEILDKDNKEIGDDY